MSEKNKWFPTINKEKEMNSHKVFCFHYAGGSSSVYKQWAVFNGPVEFIPVELPGRGTRIAEKCIEDFDSLMDELIPNLKEVIGKDIFTLYGHSMGASIAFDAACRLKSKYNILPEKLIVAGRHAPHQEDPSVFKSYMGDDKLIKELKRLNGTPKEVLENKMLLQFVLPMIRSDYKLHESYKYNGEKLSVPIIAHTGIEDYEANYNVMKEWKNMTTRGFQIKKFNGNHFFVQNLGNEYMMQLAETVTAG